MGVSSIELAYYFVYFRTGINLESFSKGVLEQFVFVTIGKNPYLRIIHPVIGNNSCLKCHPTFKENEICGGDSITIPIQSYISEQDRTLLQQSLAFLFLWILGVLSHLLSNKSALISKEKNQLSFKKIKAEKEQLESVIRGALLGTWDWNIVNDQVYFNEHWATILGYNLDEIPTTSAAWENILHPDERDWVLNEILNHLKGQTDLYVCEHRLRHKSERWIWVLEVGQVLERGKDNSPTRATGITFDLGKQKDMESAFLANMTHELRTPLNGILGYTQIFKHDQRLDVSQQEGINVIHESAEHLMEIITDILDLSKIEAGRLQLVESAYRLPDLLRQVADIIEMRSREKNLKFSFEPAPDLPQVVLGDELRLRQVLLNLLANSIKFTDKGDVELKVTVSSLDTFHEIQNSTSKPEPKKNIVGYKVNGIESTSKKILIVDDNAVNRLIARRFLTDIGFQAIEATGGDEVLNDCLQFLPDAVLMDLKMSPVDGYEATKILRDHYIFKELPIIAVSALGDVTGNIDESCRTAGFDDYIAKPVIKEVLLKKISSLLDIELILEDKESLSHSEIQSAMILPQSQKIHAILDYVMIGDLENINVELKKIEEEGPQYLPFLNHLRNMSDNFQFDALEKTLNEFLEELPND